MIDKKVSSFGNVLKLYCKMAVRDTYVYTSFDVQLPWTGEPVSSFFFCSSSIANDAVRTRLRRKFSFVRFDVNQMIFLSQKKRYDPGLEHATIELTLFKMAASYIFLEKDDFIILKTCYQRMKI